MPMDEEQKKCCGIGALGLVAILVSVVMMAIGGINIDIENSNLKNVDVVSTCKVEEKLPYYLLVAGAINIILIALRFVFQRCCRKMGEPGEDSKFCNSLNFLCTFSCITFYDILAFAIIVVWLAVGTTWTWNAYHDVEYENDANDNYCPKYLYRFTLGTVIAGWAFVILAFIGGILSKFCTCFWNILCCKPCKEADANQV